MSLTIDKFNKSFKTHCYGEKYNEYMRNVVDADHIEVCTTVLKSCVKNDIYMRLFELCNELFSQDFYGVLIDTFDGCYFSLCRVGVCEPVIVLMKFVRCMINVIHVINQSNSGTNALNDDVVKKPLPASITYCEQYPLLHKLEGRMCSKYSPHVVSVFKDVLDVIMNGREFKHIDGRICIYLYAESLL
jgi:hypothetical protein